jgi:hypothetical protein
VPSFSFASPKEKDKKKRRNSKMLPSSHAHRTPAFELSIAPLAIKASLMTELGAVTHGI